MISIMSEHKLFKVNQDAVIKNSENKILILKQSGKWKLPGGRLEDDKTPREGLLREIKEETGIDSCDVEKIIHIGISESKNTYRATFVCHTKENLITLSNEHTEYAWVTPNQLDRYEFEYEETKNILRNAT